MDVDLEQARKEYEVNVWGILAVTQAFFPMLKEAKGVPHLSHPQSTN